MSESIPPVLTPDEWAGKTMDQPSILGELPYVADDDPLNMARVMAKANSLLDAESPYKLTIADVAAITNVAQGYRDPEYIEGAQRAAAKILAMLPEAHGR